ncbi:hypothetical protein CRG98_012389 [Punica granatum]|uniref:Uncharacterized protein n=1 Tax=Punica granatum TaxID=22663 RepID=A0A2I0KFE3_PUNGR|nr:hypothetical protein CRG98_012389 [Punica granatum]
MGSIPWAHLEALDPLRIEGLKGSSLSPLPELASRDPTLCGWRGSTSQLTGSKVRASTLTRAHLEGLNPPRLEPLRLEGLDPQWLRGSTLQGSMGSKARALAP